jgi:hypothetical protein
MRELNFNTIQRPELLLTMEDEAHTQLHVGAPTAGLVEELQAKAGRSESYEAMLDLFARLISRNRENITVTVDELKDKYNFDYTDAVAFFGVYIDFVKDIKKIKN